METVDAVLLPPSITITSATVDDEMTTAQSVDDYSQYGDSSSLPVYTEALVIVAYSSIVLLSVGGNSLVVATVFSRRSMQTVTNWFIVNLACADIMMATLCVPMTFIADVLLDYWPFGAPMCPLVGYAQAVSVFLGSFTMVGISIDRHRAIRHPLRARLTWRQLSCAFGFIWTAALALPLPIAMFTRAVVQDQFYGNGDRNNDDNSTLATATSSSASMSTSRVMTSSPLMTSTVMRCAEEWPDLLWQAEMWRYGYSMLIMVVQYFLPVAVLTVTYSSIACVVWFKRRMPGEPVGDRDQRLAVSTKKVRAMYVRSVTN